MHKPSPRIASRLFLALLLPVVLTACLELVQPPDGGASLLSMRVPLLDGVTSGTMQVDAQVPWRLSSPQPWISFAPDNGVGARTVTVFADPTGLTPADNFFEIELLSDAGDLIGQGTGVLSFPDLVGQVFVGSGSSSQGLGDSGFLGLSVRELGQEPLPAKPGRLIVGLRQQGEGFGTMSLAPLHKTPGVRVTGTIASGDLAVVEATDMAAAAARLAALSEVRFVERDLPLQPLMTNDPERYRQWHLDTINVEDAWTQEPTRGDGERIAIIDSGFDPEHPDLVDRVIDQYDFGDGRGDVFDPTGACGHHGTHVAGIAAATADNFEGVAGVAPGADLLLLDVNDRTDCKIWTSDLILAIDYVAEDESGSRRADVINVSLGCDDSTNCFYQESVHESIKRAHEAGVVIVAAAGNQGENFVSYPAAYPEVIAVAATNEQDGVTAYSNYGSKIAVAAPGGEYQGIYSTYWDSEKEESSYTYMSGTSMAAPVVAGIAALVRAAAVPTLTPLDVRAVLQSSAVDLAPQGWDQHTGFGRVDAAAAVFSALYGDYRLDETIYLWLDEAMVGKAAPDGSFTLVNLPAGQHVLEAMSDDDADRQYGGPGEYYGSQTVEVAWNAEPVLVSITVERQP